ncbi:MAG: alpha/beta fold hydrolase [Sterolibacterium sp.]
MLSRLLRLFLLFELFTYVCIGLFLVKLSGWGLGWTLVSLFGMALAWRAWIILFTYGCAWLNRSQIPPEHGISKQRQVLEALREVAALGIILLMQAFERIFVKQDAPFNTTHAPMLLIHGYCCNRGFWWWLKPRLEAHGHSIATLSLEPLHGDIDGYAEQVARSVDRLCSATGASQVILVGHSMGGLVARAYLRRYGEFRVSRLVTLGTPHHGSTLAHLGMGRNARQMTPGSAWLKELEQTPPSIACVSIFSWHDNYVMPQDSAMLAGAQNIPLAGVGHLAMAISPVVLKALLAATEN